MPAAQFAYRKGLGCTDALLTIYHHLQKSLDAGMESYIVQPDFSAAFDRVSHSGLVFKLKSIGLGSSVLSICTEFFSDHMQSVVVDGATSEWIPIISGMPHGSVLGPLLFMLYNSKMFELVENSLFDYADIIPDYWQLFASQQTELLLLLVTFRVINKKHVIHFREKCYEENMKITFRENVFVCEYFLSTVNKMSYRK